MFRVKNIRSSTINKANNLSPIAPPIPPHQFAPPNKPLIKIKPPTNIHNNTTNKNIEPKPSIVVSTHNKDNEIKQYQQQKLTDINRQVGSHVKPIIKQDNKLSNPNNSHIGKRPPSRFKPNNKINTHLGSNVGKNVQPIVNLGMAKIKINKEAVPNQLRNMVEDQTSQNVIKQSAKILINRHENHDIKQVVESVKQGERKIIDRLSLESSGQQQKQNQRQKLIQQQALRQIQRQRQQEKQRQRQRQKQRQRQRQKQQKLMKKLAEQEQQRIRQEEAQIQINKILQRRKQRERQRKLQQKKQQQLQQLTIKLEQPDNHNAGLGGMMYTNDPLVHFQFMDRIMDAQINKILKTSFHHFPSGQAIQAKKGQLERINVSYMMVRDDGNVRMRDGLNNFRTQLFNQIGEMIMQDQRKGYKSTNFAIVEADHHTKVSPEVQLLRGIPKQKIPIVIKPQINQEHDRQCSICLELLEVGEKCHTFECKHVFHIKCSEDWIEMNGNCPVCRKNLKF